MNEDQALIRAETATATVALDQEALKLKAEALESCALIGRVQNAKEQATAVEAQGKLLAVIRAVEKARKAAKEPYLEMCRKIDRLAEEFATELDEEGNRLAALVNEFQEKERIRETAETRLLDEKLTQLEREENERLACADTVEAQDVIREEYSRRRYSLSAPLKPVARAKGQMVKSDFEVIVTDIHLLYRSHPQCVSLKPLISEIKALLTVGITPKGVTAKAVTKSTVRTEKPKPPIEA